MTIQEFIDLATPHGLSEECRTYLLRFDTLNDAWNACDEPTWLMWAAALLGYDLTAVYGEIKKEHTHEFQDAYFERIGIESRLDLKAVFAANTVQHAPRSLAATIKSNIPFDENTR